MHYNALSHPRPPPPDPLRAQSNTRIHRRDYIIRTHPLRRSHEHLDSARIVRNYTRIYNTSRKTNDQTRWLDKVQRPITLLIWNASGVLLKWDDAQDARQWATHAAKLDSLYAQNGKA
ncbi:hypothetical protein K503DRAFT_796794 [Rhizopogon vinicolor AM-OR11-026]|uniref:Uncharacterized protein n=1 Tax=Rhizopogon vinicolor AM-OR11-026 TaxID=1314800 RepID=A0A1B7NDB4_9AGAM|nr:hypothetical protein K503DRAFT_796794 [Rhizopogon vinicolor AM-OR11-026]